MPRRPADWPQHADQRSGTGKTVFSLHFLHNGIKQFDEPGIFVTFEESPLDILRNAASFGWNLQEMVEQDKLFILSLIHI